MVPLVVQVPQNSDGGGVGVNLTDCTDTYSGTSDGGDAAWLTDASGGDQPRQTHFQNLLCHHLLDSALVA